MTETLSKDLAEIVERWDMTKFEIAWHEKWCAETKGTRSLRYDAHRAFLRAIYQAGAEAALLAQHAVAEPLAVSNDVDLSREDGPFDPFRMAKHLRDCFLEGEEPCDAEHRVHWAAQYIAGRFYKLRDEWLAAHAAEQPKLTPLESQAQSILTNCCQLLDSIKSEWAPENCWSDWDQSIRDAASTWLKDSYALLTAPPPQKETK